MDFINEIKEETILIVPTFLKQKILLKLSQNNILEPIKFITLEELKDYFYFYTDENAVYYLEKKYHLKRDIIIKYLKNLYYIDDSLNENMCLLKKIKTELEEQNLLFKKDPSLFLKYKNAIVFGYDALTRFENKLLNELKKYLKVTILENETYDLTEAFSLKNKEEEVIFVFEQIADLIKKGIPLSKIVLTNVKEDYQKTILNISKKYHIPVSFKRHTLYGTQLYQKIKNEIIEGEETTSGREKDILIQKLNALKKVDKEDIPSLLDYYASKIFMDEEIKNGLRIEPLENNFFCDDEYVFILSFNASILPVIHQDEDFLYDKIKPQILETTIELNELEKTKIKHALKKIHHKIITFKREDASSMMFPSSLLEDVEIKEEEITFSNRSHQINLDRYFIALDDFRKYGITASNLASFEKKYTLAYQTFNHQFKGIDTLHLKENKLLLSYSSLNEFFECNFKFYLNHILKISTFEETFQAYLGSLFHDCLMHAYDTEIQVDKLCENYLEKHPFPMTSKEKFFLEKTKKDITETIIFLKSMEEHSDFKKYEFERKLYYKMGSKINITFMGIIDKIFYFKDYIAVVDYKTGSVKIKLEDLYHGLSMQLPVYLFLMKKLFPEKEVAGFFIQNVLENNFKHLENKTVEEQKQASLKLNGFTTDNIDILKSFDTTYQDSRYIQGLKISKTGFYPYSKVLSNTKMDQIVAFTEKKIEEAITKIEEKDFVINPKFIRRENISCKFCPYKSICYHTDQDIIYLEEKKDLSFLGGEEDANMDTRANGSNL